MLISDDRTTDLFEEKPEEEKKTRRKRKTSSKSVADAAEKVTKKKRSLHDDLLQDEYNGLQISQDDPDDLDAEEDEEDIDDYDVECSFDNIPANVMSEADEQQYIDDDGLTLGSGSGKCRDILDDLGDLSDLPDISDMSDVMGDPDAIDDNFDDSFDDDSSMDDLPLVGEGYGDDDDVFDDSFKENDAKRAHDRTSSAGKYASILAECQDEEIVKLAKDGDDAATEYLISKYKNFVRVKAKSYFLVGADREDIIQEGMIGLYKSIRDFRSEKLSSFRAFAELCITRQIITAIKTATRQKHIPLNSYVSLNKPIYDEDSDRTMLDILSSNKISDPEEVYISTELSGDLRAKIKENLSDLESQVLMSYLEGKSYQEMAKELGRHVKSIDNALQRVKRKIEKTLGHHDR